ncbi:MAG: acyltransferase family protein [Chthoniobacterales bacterium]
MTARRSPKHIPELDGVRGIALGLVLIWHYGVCQAAGGDPNTWVGILKNALSLTWSGVDLFFILSGFLIVGILIDAREAPHYFKAFFTRRVCRILPVYYLILLLFPPMSHLALASHNWLFKEALPFWSYFFFLQNFFMHSAGFGPNWLGVTWSLAIEEQFYLLIPLFIRFLSQRWLTAIFVTMIIISPLMRHWLGYWGNYTFPLARADAIAFGALLALLVRNNVALIWLKRHRNYILSTAIVLSLGFIPLTLWKIGIGHPLGHLYLAIIYAAFLLSAFVCRGGTLSRILSARSLCWLGTRSYAIYLFHQPIAGLVYGAMGYSRPRFSSLSESTIMFFCLAIVFVLAECSMRCIERPAMQFGHRIRYT